MTESPHLCSRGADERVVLMTVTFLCARLLEVRRLLACSIMLVAVVSCSVCNVPYNPDDCSSPRLAVMLLIAMPGLNTCWQLTFASTSAVKCNQAWRSTACTRNRVLLTAALDQKAQPWVCRSHVRSVQHT